MSTPIAVPAANVHAPPAQWRKATEATPEPASVGAAVSAWPLRIAAAAAGAVMANAAGAVLSTRRAATVSMAVLPATSVTSTRRS